MLLRSIHEKGIVGDPNGAIDDIMEDNPNLTIIKTSYEKENDLDNDWRSFTRMSSADRDYANMKAVKLYGMTNPKMYKHVKKKFLTKIEHDHIDDTAMGSAVSEETNDWYSMEYKNKRARDFIIKNQFMYEIILGDITNLDELNKSYFRYLNMPDDARKLADDESIKIYGKTNEERYYEELNSILKNTDDLDGDIVDKEYDSYNVIRDVDQDKQQRYETDLNDFLSESTLLENMNAIETPEIWNNGKKRFQLYKSIDYTLQGKKIDLGSQTPYFLPSEMIYGFDARLLLGTPMVDLGDTHEKSPWFLNYKLKSLGLKPIMNNYYGLLTDYIHKNKITMDSPEADEIERARATQNILECGWNPVVDSDQDGKQKTSNRLRNIMQEQCGYRFIDLSESTIIESNEDMKPLGGLYVLLFTYHDIKTGQESNNIYVSMDSTLKDLYQMDNGFFDNKADIKDILEICTKYIDTMFVKVYYLSMSNSLVNKIKEKLEYMSNNYMKFGYSFMIQISQMLSASKTTIANSNVFCSYLMNYIITLSNIDLRRPDISYIYPTLSTQSVGLPPGDISVHILYDGNMMDFRINEIWNKLKFITNSNLIRESYENNHILFEVSLNEEDGEILNEFTKLRFGQDRMNPMEHMNLCLNQLKKAKNKNDVSLVKKLICKLWLIRDSIRKKLLITNKHTDLSRLYNSQRSIDSGIQVYINYIKNIDPHYNFIDSCKSMVNPRLELSTSWDDLDRIINGFTNN